MTARPRHADVPAAMRNLRDGCPVCAARDNEPYEQRAGSSSVVCRYRCASCGANWYTTWLLAQP
jgi:transposase-like protein